MSQSELVTNEPILYDNANDDEELQVNFQIDVYEDMPEDMTNDTLTEESNLQVASNVTISEDASVEEMEAEDMQSRRKTLEIGEALKARIIQVRKLVLPQAIVMRIIKDSIPRSTRVRVEVRDGISSAAIKFIHFLTALGVKNAQTCKRKTVAVQDIFDGLIQAGFQDFIRPLQDLLIERNHARQAKLTPRRVVALEETPTSEHDDMGDRASRPKAKQNGGTTRVARQGGTLTNEGNDIDSTRAKNEKVSNDKKNEESLSYPDLRKEMRKRRRP